MHERLFLADRSVRLAAGPVYPIDIGMDEPVPLRVEPRHPQIGITVAQYVRIKATGSPVRQDRFEASDIGYFYALTTVDGNEILSFHWNSQTIDPDQRDFPHLHIGAINLDPGSLIRPGTFHKMHVPTGYITVEDVIRLAITELSVRPLRSDWEQVLERTAITRSSR
jgi:hypothetical protein